MHWLMFLLLVAVYACIELREFYPKGSDPRKAFKTLHSSGLVFGRIHSTLQGVQLDYIQVSPSFL